jgi:hypothetical protein
MCCLSLNIILERWLSQEPPPILYNAVVARRLGLDRMKNPGYAPRDAGHIRRQRRLLSWRA